MEHVRVGFRAGRLTVTGEAGRAPDGHRMWQCRCDCGATVTRHSGQLRARRVHSCGCAQADLQTTHGYHGTRTYDSWRSAIERCHNENSKDWPRYGARGVTVCARWRTSFEHFLTDMGERPEGTTLDRHPNNDGNYEPGNCRWATPKEQARNRRRPSVITTWKGEERLLADVASELGITYGAAYNRLQRKGTLE